ncbi:MAG: hypothetical protein ACOC0W_07595 [Desulfosalsimonas sp.]
MGFIRDLPRELRVAFRATLEELESADLLLHVIDGSNPACREQIESVNKILEELSLTRIPVINVINKSDLMEEAALENLAEQTGAEPVCARNSKTLRGLIEKMEHAISRDDNNAAVEYNPEPEQEFCLQRK